MRRALKQPIRTAVATAFVLRAALRARWYEPRTDLPALVERLKAVPRSRVGFDASLADGVLERLLPILPPWRAGRCVKRSLVQLDLWSRAGRSPRLHLGWHEAGANRGGHVWVTAGNGDHPRGVEEAWSS